MLTSERPPTSKSSVSPVNGLAGESVAVRSPSSTLALPVMLAVQPLMLVADTV